MKNRRLIFESLKVLVRRSIHEVEARRVLWGALRPLAIFILVEAILVVLLAWSFPIGRQKEFWVFLAVIFSGGLGVGWLLRKLREGDSTLASYPLNDGLTPHEEVRNYLWRRMEIARGMALRALEDVAETRQQQNAFYRAEGLWEQLEGDERELAMAPGGGWSLEQRQRVVEWCEQLRLLRWVLFLDEALTPLWMLPKPEYELFKLPARVSDLTRRSWDIATERDQALAYVAGTIQQMARRGLLKIDDRLLEGDLQLPAGAGQIEDLSDDDLNLLAHTASVRARYTDYLAAVIGRDQVIRFHEFPLFEDN